MKPPDRTEPPEWVTDAPRTFDEFNQRYGDTKQECRERQRAKPDDVCNERLADGSFCTKTVAEHIAEFRRAMQRLREHTA